MVHLPAVNTPQFDWCETTLDRHPQPVPPIYQPEIPARHIVDVALTGRRSKIVGSWNKLLGGAGSVLPGSVTSSPDSRPGTANSATSRSRPDRPVNLHRPADDATARGAHGAFDDRSGGFWDPRFLCTLPATLATFVRAAGRATREKTRRLGPSSGDRPE